MTPSFLSISQVDSILASSTQPRHKLQILLLADSGLRVSELINLTWDDLDFRLKQVRVKSLKKRKKGNAVRLLPMSDRLFNYFVEYIELIGGRGQGFLFSKDGGISHISRQAVNKMLKTIEGRTPEVEDLHPHKLRHTFATKLRANGAELADIKDSLGHEKLDTALIYAHADMEKLRMLINGKEEKKARFPFFTLFRSRAKRNSISILEYDRNYTVGREDIVRTIEKAMEKEISVVLVGPVGIGKTHILNAIRFKKKVLEIDDLKDFKRSVLGILLHLFGGDKQKAAQMIFNKGERDSWHKTMLKDSMLSLVDLLLQVTAPREYILRVSDIDTLTPTVSRAMERLKKHFVIVTTCREIKMTSFFIYDFERIPIEPLTRVESMRLFLRLMKGYRMESVEHARNKVWETSEGNPKMIVELCTRLAKEEMLIPENVNEICDNYIGRQTKEFDMSIILMVLLLGVISLRYIGIESQDPDLRMIGGIMMIILIFGRRVFKGAGRRTL